MHLRQPKCHGPGVLVLALLAAVLLAGCGSVSKLRAETRDAASRIAASTRVEVLDFAASAAIPPGDAEATERARAALAAGCVELADRIAAELGKRQAFAEVSREPLEGERLVVGGAITRFEEGNVVARMATGFLGQAHLEGDVEIRDGVSGEVLGRFRIDRNSWPLPVAASTNAVQNVGLFIGEAARVVAEELTRLRTATPSSTR